MIVIHTCLASISFVVFFLMYHHLIQHGETIPVPSKPLILVSFFLFLMIMYFLYPKLPVIGFYLYGILIMYLFSTAYIDHYTLSVFRGFQVPAFIISTLAFVMITPRERIVDSLVQVCLFYILLFIQKWLKLYGAGDTDVFFAITPWIATMNALPLYVLMIHAALCTIIHVMINLTSFDLRHMKLKETKAYVPAIFISSIVCIYLI